MDLTETLRQHGIATHALDTLLESSDLSIPALPVRGHEALELWTRLRDLFPQTGHWPLVLGDDEELGFHRDQLGFKQQDGLTTRDLLEQARSIDLQAWFAERRAQGYGVWLEELRGAWPLAQPGHNSILSFNDLFSGKPKARLHLALIPVGAPWQIPAVLGMGGWNECPEAAVQVALWRYWHQRHGSEPVCLTHDVLETRVAQPPATREEALRLAEEQFVYCPDLVTQGVETVSRLAATLLNSRYWYFWWD
ncbi:hypothetical protein Mterra_03441 [Calidithermus terrae]|uniref:DUF4253 domain-containing protein n=1 Tax=Calidithermus terrae TaxID=1408545 RepID=A0A399ED02_9DEIN|nr:DUF4253 domain-containing protein [Calidithermus terrae]RIH80830.1 hypothetical protein Mterra_03441 [Calidithermus terrae]